MISAILLAAGESRRMGSFKQLLPFGRNTVIESCVSNLLSARVDELIVVLGHRAQDLLAHLSGLPVKTVVNEDYSEGMTRSIQTGVLEIDPNARAFLLALVDQPRISPEIVDRLIDEYEQSGALIVKPPYKGKSGHPIIIDLACRDEILGLTSDMGLHVVTRAHAEETRYVDIDSPAVVEDMDTPEDYARQRDRRN